jgi:hypothetical protein
MAGIVMNTIPGKRKGDTIVKNIQQAGLSGHEQKSGNESLNNLPAQEKAGKISGRLRL